MHCWRARARRSFAAAALAIKPDYREKIWDQAAGSLVLEEAGGRISDLDGPALEFHHRGVR